MQARFLLNAFLFLFNTWSKDKATDISNKILLCASCTTTSFWFDGGEWFEPLQLGKPRLGFLCFFFNGYWLCREIN